LDISRVTCFEISGHDQPGETARFAKHMAEHEINLAAVLSFGIGRGNAEIVAIPHDPPLFRKAVKYTGWIVREGSCFHLTGEDRAGALAETLEKIAQEGINLQAVYAIGLGKQYSAYFWCNEQDIEKIRKILKGW
jgi:hypothetical protein